MSNFTAEKLQELTVHIKLKIPEKYFTDKLYGVTEGFVIGSIQKMADGLQGYIGGFEIK